MKTTTVAELQEALKANPETSDIEVWSDDVQTANPFAGLRIDVEPEDAWGLVEGKVRAALTEAGRIASEEQIRAETARLWGPAADTTAKSGVTGVTLRTTVNGVESEPVTITPEQFHRLADGELPGMPEKPAPKLILRVPSDAEFADDDEFFISSSLNLRAIALRERHPDLFEHLSGMSVTYLWKKAGGKSKGRGTFGKTTKPSGLLKLFSESTFVIWLAADHCRAWNYQDREIEALLFHEMLHTSVAEVDEDTGRGGGPVLVPHELEVFKAEVEVYGLWAADLKEVGPAFQQLTFSAAVELDEMRREEAEQGQNDGSGLDCAECGSFVDPERGGQLCDSCRHRAEVDRLPADGQLIHDDGSPLTAEEIAEMEAREAHDL